MLAKTLSGENGQEIGVQVKPVRVGKLANVLGKTLKVITVNYALGDKSGEQHHVGSVLPMCSRAIISENPVTGRVKVCKAGENFFGLPGS